MFFTFKLFSLHSQENSFAWIFIHLEIYVYETGTFFWDFCRQFGEHNISLSNSNIVSKDQISQKSLTFVNNWKKKTFLLAFRDGDSSFLWLIQLLNNLSLFCDISSDFNKTLSLLGQKSKVGCLYVKYITSVLISWVLILLHLQHI